MAGGPYGMNTYQQRVAIAVDLHADEVEEVSARFAFRPETLACATPECHMPRLYRFVVGFLVHEAQHEYVARCGVLNDGRYQTVAHLVKV